MGWDNPPVPWRELERRLSWGTGEDPGDAEQDPRPVTRLPARAHHGPPWAELHCHSSYSFLDGASSPAELVAEAARLGLEALAITDHNGMYGVPQFAQAAAKLTEQTGIKLGTVFGAELSVGSASPGEHAAFPGASPRTPGPGPPRWLKAPFLRHRALALLARGSDPPGTPRWLKAPFLRHRALALLARGSTPLEPPRWLKAPFLRHRALAAPGDRAGSPDPDGQHLLVLARDPGGYRRLCWAISVAQLAGGAKGRPVYDRSNSPGIMAATG